MTSAGNSGHGYQVTPLGLTEQVTALTGIGDQTSGLVTSARQLAERLPMLGTAPPAMHLAMRLRETAGQSGLTGEISAADTELHTFHCALKATVTGYLETDASSAEALRDAGGAAS